MQALTDSTTCVCSNESDGYTPTYVTWDVTIQHEFDGVILLAAILFGGALCIAAAILSSGLGSIGRAHKELAAVLDAGVADYLKQLRNQQPWWRRLRLRWK